MRQLLVKLLNPFTIIVMSFKDIKGQDYPLNMLKGCLKESRLGSGYLFTGPEGVGKKLAAMVLAKAVNCLGEAASGTGPNVFLPVVEPCGRCVSCRKIDNNQHPDVHIIGADESEVKIEHIRSLQRQIILKPYEGKVKVFIVDNAHTLTGEASNAFLKILEEPPGDSLIILITDKSALLFKTIVSRCKIVKFLPLARGRLKEILERDYNIASGLAHFLAYFSEGRLGRALRLKDSDILEERNRVVDSFVFSSGNKFGNLAAEDRKSAAGRINLLASWFRDIYLIKAGLPCLEIINFDRKDELAGLSGRLSFLRLNEIFSCISDSILQLEENLNVKLVLYNLKETVACGL